MLRIILICLSLLPGGLWASGGDFTLDASVDKDKVELGEAVRFTLRLHLKGNLDFPPQMEPPKFDGFNAQGPQQGSNVTWVNGQVSMDYTWAWELVPIKAGTLTLGPYVGKAKDAQSGEIIRSTKPITLQVRRPKKLAFNLPAQAPQAAPEPLAPGSEELRDIKADRGMGWQFWTALAAGLLALGAFAAWWLLWRKARPKVVAPKDPLAHCLGQLAAARDAFDADQDGKAFAIGVDAAVRAYLRLRLDQTPGATLRDCLRAYERKLPWLERASRKSLQDRLILLLYGDAKALVGDRDGLFGDASAIVKGLERCEKAGPLLAELEQKLQVSLDHVSQGRPKQGWMGLRATFLAHVRKTTGLVEPRRARAEMARWLAALEAPELIAAAELIYEQDPPAGLGTEEIKERLMALARALLIQQRGEIAPAREPKEEDDGE